MTGSTEIRRDTYDVIVIGSGMGGMTASALLARAGKSVLVVEGQPALGGYAHAFRRGPYTIDPAVHSVLDPDLYHDLLTHLGVRDQCEFLPIEHLYGAQFPGTYIAAPATTVEDVIGVYCERFPQSSAEIERFLRLCERIHREGHDVSQVSDVRDLDTMVARFPALFRYARATLKEVLDEFFTDERVGYAISAMGGVLGLPPSRLSFQTFAQMMISYLVSGAFYARGGAGTIVEALAEAIRADGGDIVTGMPARRILMEGGRVSGVRLRDGSEIRARVVVSNADLMQTVNDLVGPEHFAPTFIRGLRRLKPSASGFSLLAASTLDFAELDAADTTIYSASWNVDEVYGQTGSMHFVYIPTLVDASLAPRGEHIVSVLNTVPYDIGKPWQQAKERYREIVLAAAERQYPGFRESLVFDEVSTPLTLERYSSNHRGSVWGWENTPVGTGSKRPGQHSPIDGLYLVGHWTQPGSGFARVTVSGINVARLVLQADGVQSGAELFESDRLPGSVAA